MKRGIVTVEETEQHRQLLREAGEWASGSNAELVLLALVPESKFEEDIETLDTISEVENVQYGESTVVEAARTEVQEIAREVLSDLDVSVTSVTAVVDEDDQAGTLVSLGAKHDCNHAFIVGQRRSPTGKALFGDDAQRVLLNFDGYVTVHLQ